MTPAPDNLPTRERVAELLKLVTGQRIDGTPLEQLREEIAAILSAYLRLTQDNEWIAVTERLPEKAMAVLVSVSEPRHPEWPGFIDRAYFRGGKSFFYGQTDAFENVTHWRPLPSPPPSENSTGGGK